jgi:hypothetical protein
MKAFVNMKRKNYSKQRHLAQNNDGMQRGPCRHKASIQRSVIIQDDGMKSEFQTTPQKNIHGYDIVKTAFAARSHLRIETINFMKHL